MKPHGSHKALALTVFLALALSGCATKEDVVKVEERVISLEANLRRAEAGINRVDSLARSGQSGKSGEYAKLQATIQALSDEVERLTNNVTELQDRLSYLQSQKSTSAVTGGSGGSDGGAQAQANTPGIDCSKLYDDSFIQIRQREYESALAGFADYLEYCGGGDRADNAQYWIAEAHYSRKDFKTARVEYDKLVKTYPSSEKLATAYYKLGRCAEESGDSKSAQGYYETVTSKYPSTTEAQLASDKLIELKGSSANRGG